MIEKTGSRVTAKYSQGATYSRNTSFIKKFHPIDEGEEDHNTEDQSSEHKTPASVPNKNTVN